MTVRIEDAGPARPKWTSHRGSSAKVTYDLRQGDAAPIKCALPGDIVVIHWGEQERVGRTQTVTRGKAPCTPALVAWHQGVDTFVRIRGPRWEVPDVLDDLLCVSGSLVVRFLGLRA